MAGYIGTKAVNLSTTGADINGNANVDGTLDVTGAFTSLGIDDNAAATAVTIDASGNVGIGTVAPSAVGSRATVDVSGSAGAAIRLSDDTANMFIDYTDTSGGRISVNAAEPLVLRTNSLDRMTIDSSGNVGIGTVTPSSTLEISATTLPILNFERQDSTFGNGIIRSVGNTGTVNAEIQLGGGSNNYITFDTNASEAMRIDSSGNVGIGTASPEVQLETFGAAQTYNFNAGTDPLANFAIINNNINSGTGPAIVLGSTYSGSSTVANARIFAERQSTGGTNAGATDLIFEVGQASGSALAERMRIDSSGNVLVGTTTSSNKSAAASGVDIGTEVRAAGTFITHTTGENLLLNSDSGVNVRFYKSGAYSGAITTTGTTTAYITTSDYRLKENVTLIQGAGDIVKAMRPVTYTYKSDGSWMDGFLAHELQELHPRAVTGSKDAMVDEEYEVTPAVEATYDDEGVELTPAVPAVMGTRSVPDYQGVDYSKLTPILTAALQEALNKIDTLEARLTALEATP